MRFLTFLLLLAFIVLGVLFGALNPDLVSFDFGVTRLMLPKGAVLLAVLVLGWLLGGLTAWWGTRWRKTRDRHAAAHGIRKDRAGK